MQRLLLLLAFLLLTDVPGAVAQTKPRLTLTIIPTEYATSYAAGPVIRFDHTGCFYVLLTNKSEQSVNLFEEWNSWGYFGLSFEIRYTDGRTVRVLKAERGWDKNLASTVPIAPHGFHVFAVTFNTNPSVGDVWANSPRREKSNGPGIRCRLRAVYSIANSTEAVDKKAWTGAVSSSSNTYTLWP